MRSVEELEQSGLAVIEQAFTTPAQIRRYAGPHKPRKIIDRYAEVMAPLFSGGHDSLVATHLASKHPKFTGVVNHIDTGIGSRRTRQFVEDTCRDFGWQLQVYKSSSTYEMFVRDRGFPGPAMHQWSYIRLKDRCVRQIVRGQRVALITGCRVQESTRRMGHVQPLKIGEVEGHKNKKTGLVEEKVVNLNRYWSAPCHDWSSAEQNAYMDYYDLPRNPVKLALGMSGECCCGAFAAPGELERLRVHVPDVAAEIDRLTEIAKECGKHATWGTRPPKDKGIVVSQTGPLCSSCDYRAAAAGIVIECSTKGSAA